MGMPAAKQGDQVVATDIHVIMVPAPPAPPVPTPLPHPFVGIINSGLSTNVNIMGMPAAILGCKAQNTPPHIPMAPGSFQKPPTNQATIIMGSATVMINNKPAVRMGDTAMTCNDPADLPSGKVIAAGTVFIGG
jgi:uncharacterized Zn-binding protein involved in type VI secretion